MGKPYEIEIYVLRDSPDRGISRQIWVKRPKQAALRIMWNLIMVHGADYVDVCTDEPEVIVLSRTTEYLDYVEKQRRIK